MLYACAQSHDCHDHCITLIPNTTPSTSSRRRPVTGRASLALVVALAPHFFAIGAAAVPFTANELPRGPSLHRRDNEQQVPVQLWVPILIVGFVIAVSLVGLCWRRGVLRFLTPANTASRASGPRELTAEQLAGTINGNAAQIPGAGANRTRRTRRPRRTPSQISTTSLPAYAKEPGEQELVIIRGPEDMEDAGMPRATVVMEPLSEDAEDSLHSGDNSHSSQYPELPATPVDEPLLERDVSTADLSPGDDMPRRSLETLDSSEEATSLMRVNSISASHDDPRGEAPPYFEAIDIAPESSTAETSLPSSTSSPASPGPVPQRRSGFRTLLQSLPNRLSMQGSSSHAPSHSRADSSLSMGSSQPSHGREASQSRASHRPTPSGSSSFISLSHFRTLSRQKSRSNHNLNSPSLISLNSISAPLTHTLTRTEFTYPKSGPTPEQLKLISSRESFARFAVPYGPDAIAYAASASRQNLDDVPPPDFDALQTSSTDNQSPGSAGAGPSRLRTTSDAAGQQQDSGWSPETPDGLPDGTLPPVSEPPAPTTASASSSTIPDAAGTAGASSSALDPLRIPLPSSPKAPETLSSTPAEPSALAVPKPLTQSPGAPVAHTSNSVPPTSFKAPTTFDARSPSRASSLVSYATAKESMASQSDMSESEDEEEMETPTTPKLGPWHVLEATDATIRTNSEGAAAAGPSQ
ncbi:hypothetical protein LshimejAT787_0703530 [Lyophyllum shimeji]|uniref:Proteophosphoglycan ppg4 n=1 Tax=Lyophyllum shimeji TaxID=47721 RepID=A0A9P3PQQ6_LYOSH|nr:hypothetical protein LshimejAT787_0703530 [Lyophyllum shimeji]